MNEKVTAKKDMGFLTALIAIIAVIAIADLLTGCATSKSRAIDASGMYMSETGQLAVGRVHVDAIPEGQESAVVHYTEDTALLSPDTKTHDIDVILTGSNSVLHASEIVASICDAFVAVAPGLAKTEAAAPKGKTALDVAKANAAANAEVKKVKAASDDHKHEWKFKSAKAADCAACEDCDAGKAGVSPASDCPDCDAGKAGVSPASDCPDCEVK